jgi:hypothetical protein
MAINIFPKVSIIFPNLNGGIQPIECLSSIQKLTYPKGKTEVIVVDNGSTDGSCEEIAKKFPNVILIKLKADIGFAASINLGIRNSNGSYIFVGNDDIIFEKKSIAEMVFCLQKNKNIAVLGGKVFYKDKSNVLTDSASDFNFYSGSIKPSNLRSNRPRILWLQSCAVMVPKAVFKKIGLFDKDFYPIYFDDFDFCLRATRAGYKLYYCPEAVFWHGYGKTTKKSSSFNFFYWWYKNKIRFILKNANLLQILSSISVQLLLIPFSFLKMKDFDRGRAILKAFWWNIKNLSPTISSRNKI